MAKGIEEIKKTNLFIKSSVDDFQDPVFLTFRIDFFPPAEQYPKYDGLTNSSLLKDPILETVSMDTTIRPNNQNEVVEYSTETWLNEYYRGYPFPPQMTPHAALQQFKTKLRQIQDSPWYFQSIQGIGDLWKSMHRVKEGNQKTTLIFNCLDSIKQPLTEMAENYRYAIYDQERLAYRVPENLRWFDMVIDLVEIRDIVDRSGQFYKAEGNELTSGLRVVQFRCKMCEFDFSGFMGGSQSDHKTSTEEKSFAPSFNINVGWVIQEPVSLSEAHAFRQMGMFSGALDSLNSSITRFLQTATRLPGAIVGSVLNEIQTIVETKVIGNAYTGFNEFMTDMNNVSGNLTGRNPVVGPPLVSNLNEDVYPAQPSEPGVSDLGTVYPAKPITPSVGSMGDLYPTILPGPPVANMGDLYPDETTSEIQTIGDIYPTDPPGLPVNEIGDIYPTEPPNPATSNIGDVYPDEPPAPATSTIGDVYPDEPPTPQVSNMGDLYPDQVTPTVGEIGDIYPDEPLPPAASDMGDVYQDQVTESISEIGDVYPDQPAAPSVSDMGDAYPGDQAQVESSEIGNAYPDAETTNPADEIGDVYQGTEDTQKVEELGDVYPDEPKPEEISEIGDVYPESGASN